MTKYRGNSQHHSGSDNYHHSDLNETVTGHSHKDEPSSSQNINLVNQNTSKDAINQQASNPPIHPFVHWAQTQTQISLRVDLVQAENLKATIIDGGKSLIFNSKGRGAHGLKDYHFRLDFYSPVEEKFDCHLIERYVLILIKKRPIEQINWPRLTEQYKRLAWLRIDFDRYSGDGSDNLADSDYDDSLDNELGVDRQALNQLKGQISKQQQSPDFDPKKLTVSDSKKLDNIFADKKTDIFNPFKRRNYKNRDYEKTSNMKYDYRKDTVATDSGKNTARHALDFKKTYLFLYNVLMFIMFLKVFIVLIIKELSGTIDDEVVSSASFIIKILTYTQLLETVHPILGLVPGGPMMPFLQVLGRLLVNFYLTEPSIRIHSEPFAKYLFVVWSSIEIFRYSFYALRVFKVDFYALTWFRYTLFMPLYPMGGVCESMIILSTIKYYEKTGGYSVSMPNTANISFSLPIFLRIYIVILFATIYYLMRYMWAQRCKQLKEKVA